MEFSRLIDDSSEFSNLNGEIASILDATKDLPDEICRVRPRKCIFLEHSNIYRNEFAEFLVELTRAYGDSRVNFMSIDPDPKSYFFDKTGNYGIASFAAEHILSDYLRLMAREGSADSFLVRGGDRGCFWGNTKQWLIYCDRVTWEVMIVCLFEPKDVSIGKIKCLDGPIVSEYLLHQRKCDLPNGGLEFKRLICENYPLG